MKNKIIALMAVIPILLLFTILTMTSTVSIAFDMPVSSVKIVTKTDNGVLNLDMALYASDKFLEVEVLPSNAANPLYSINYSAVENVEQGEISIDEEGRILAVKPGKVKVTVTTNDGGFKDSIIVNVTSSKALDLALSASDLYASENVYPVINKGDGLYSVTVKSGRVAFSAEPYPSGANGDIKYSYAGALDGISPDDGFSINVATGVAEARVSGKYLVYVTTDGVRPDGVHETLRRSIEVSVEKADSPSEITVEGQANYTLTALPNALNAQFYIESPVKPTVGVSDNVVTAEVTQLGATLYSCTVTFVDSEKSGRETINVSAGGKSYGLKIEYAERKTEILSRYSAFNGALMQKAGTTLTYTAYSTPTPSAADGAVYRFEVEGAMIAEQSGASCSVTASETGNGVLRVYISLAGEEEYLAAEAQLKFVAPYSSMLFGQSASTYGIKDRLTVGDTAVANGEYVKSLYSLNLNAWIDGQSVYPPEDELVIESSDPSVAEIIYENGVAKIQVNANGTVTLKARWLYSDIFKENVFALITVDCVKGAVTVGDYASLMKASNDGRKIVLSNDVMLGEQLKNSDGTLIYSPQETNIRLKKYVKELPTTADWTYYANIGQSQPNVRYCVEFKNDVYGNGYTLDGDYITQISPVDYPTASVFDGPKDFVSMKNMASVKAQDNIVFLVRTDGIVIDNVNLKGCSDESLYEGDKFEVSYLNYVGTTLEIMSDDVTVKNSRISNGRTVVRIYGRDNIDLKGSPVDAQKEKIDVAITSCILSNAREFILKIGTNRKIYGRWDESDREAISPYLTGPNGVKYQPRNDNNINDEYFAQNYVLTEVTLENSALSTSGLFAVGMESSFAGGMLDGGGDPTLGPIAASAGWRGIAGTSYAAMLHLKGDVKIYDWKPLAFVDSSTLIELATGIGESYPFLQLDIKSMLDQVRKAGIAEEYESIIANINGSEYVHGGIAFYGGGKNYSMIDLADFKGEMFNRYSVNLSILANESTVGTPMYDQGTMLPLAAGNEDFRFFMYGSDSLFDYAEQQRQFANGTAYDFITPA